MSLYLHNASVVTVRNAAVVLVEQTQWNTQDHTVFLEHTVLGTHRETEWGQ